MTVIWIGFTSTGSIPLTPNREVWTTKHYKESVLNYYWFAQVLHAFKHTQMYYLQKKIENISEPKVGSRTTMNNNNEKTSSKCWHCWKSKALNNAMFFWFLQKQALIFNIDKVANGMYNLKTLLNNENGLVCVKLYWLVWCWKMAKRKSFNNLGWCEDGWETPTMIEINYQWNWWEILLWCEAWQNDHLRKYEDDSTVC